MNQKANSLMEGSIPIGILKFALPIFLGSLFQQLYNMADTIIVGNYAGELALAAVTSTGTIVFLFIGFFTGMYQGMSVIVARCYGANDKEAVQRSVTTAAAFGFCSGVFLTIVGVLCSSIVVELVGTPEEVYQDSVIYLRIFFAGALFTAFYNTVSGISRALGDSRRPLYYLAVASVINVTLDLVMVGAWGMGVVGAASATVIAQAVSAALSYYRLTHMEEFKLRVRNIRREFDINLLKQMIQIGIPSGVQNSVAGFANLVVQANVNSFGSIVMAGNGAYMKLQGMVFLPIESFGMATTTFVSQNLGAGKKERVRLGAKFGVIFPCVIAETMGIIAFIFAPSLIGAFGGGAEATAIGVMKIYVDCFFYCFLAYAHAVSSVMRGAGKAKTPMFIMFGIWCVLRVIYIEVVMCLTNDILLVFWVYPITWVASWGLFYQCYRKFRHSLLEK